MNGMLAMPSLNCQCLSALGVIPFAQVTNDLPSHAYYSFTDVSNSCILLCINCAEYYFKIVVFTWCKHVKSDEC